MQATSAKPPSIQAIYHSGLPRTYIDDLYEELSTLFPGVVSMDARKDERPWGAWEWALPAVVAIYIIGKPILNGFLQEIGAGGARALKTTLVRLFSRAKQANIRQLSEKDLKVLLQTKGRDRRLKQESVGHPVPILSVHVELGDTGSTAEFLFLRALDESKFLRALESLDSAIATAILAEESRLKIGKHDPQVRPRLLYYVYHVDRSDWLLEEL